jgi:AcrR family transcriptional regulator
MSIKIDTVPRRRAEHPPRQARSRETLQQLLDAAEAMLLRHGAEGATLPRIAKHAGVAPATVYRRFRNKDALMAAVFNRFAERSSGAVGAQFDPESVRPIGLVQFSTNVIQGMVKGFRASGPLTRAAMQYAEDHPRNASIRATAASEARGFEQMVDAFLIWRGEIKHPDPEHAIRFAFLIVACVLRDLVIFDRMRLMRPVMSVDDDLLKHELPRVFLHYLGVQDK